MLSIQPVTQEELKLLEDHYHTSKTRLVRERAHTVLLGNDGYTCPEIANILRKDAQTVRQWFKEWNERRISSLFPAYAGNTNASKLTTSQREEIRRTLAQPPSAYGLPDTFWSLPRFKQYVHASFGVIYESDRSYHYLLQYGNLSWKLSSPFDRRRDETLIISRMREIMKEIMPMLSSDNWVVLTADETKATYDTQIRRAWLKKGEKTTIKTDRHRTHQNYFGALNQQTGDHHLIPIAWQNQKTMIHALTELTQCYPNKRICIIWDNAAWHKGKELRRHLEHGHSLERIHLINLPPYAPDQNPQEHVWKYGKEKISNQTFDSFEEMTALFERTLTRRFHYKMSEFVLR